MDVSARGRARIRKSPGQDCLEVSQANTEVWEEAGNHEPVGPHIYPYICVCVGGGFQQQCFQHRESRFRSWLGFCRSDSSNRTKFVAMDMGLGWAEKTGHRIEVAEAEPVRRFHREHRSSLTLFQVPSHRQLSQYVAFPVKQCKSGGKCSTCRTLFYRKLFISRNI